MTSIILLLEKVKVDFYNKISSDNPKSCFLKLMENKRNSKMLLHYKTMDMLNLMDFAKTFKHNCKPELHKRESIDIFTDSFSLFREKNKCMCGSSNALCYERVHSSSTHNSFSCGEDVIRACRANKAECQWTRTLHTVPSVSAIIAHLTLRANVGTQLRTCIVLDGYFSLGKTSGPTTKAVGSDVLP